MTGPSGEIVYSTWLMEIRIPENWVSAYLEYKSQYELYDRLFPWSPRRLEYLLEDIGKDAGLPKHLSFDMCRWTSVLQDYVNNVEPEKIRQKLGAQRSNGGRSI
jgi:integrase/recombinase XerD